MRCTPPRPAPTCLPPGDTPVSPRRVGGALTLLLGLAVLLPAPAVAWNAAGHRLVATIAWRQLDPDSRSRLAALLARHPDHGRWTARAGDPGQSAFVEASTWPDDIRRDPRFFDDGETATPSQSGYPDMARHGAWHYVDEDARGRRLGGELDRQIDRLSRLLADPRGAPGERAYALPWLIHLVADAHQPLHAGVRDDEGGNRVSVHDPRHPRLSVMSLHAWWDDLPGPPWLRGQRLERAATALEADHPAPPMGSPTQWIRESRQLATGIYPPGETSPLVIEDDYRSRARQLAGERLVAAGHRLARLLAALLPAGESERNASPPLPAR